MSFALAAVDKFTVVLEADPNTLLVTPTILGKVMVLPPVPSCVKTTVPYEPTNGIAEKLKVLFCVNVIAAFAPSVGFQLMVDPV
jgi:hypothetical protein